MKVLMVHNDYLVAGGEYYSVREEFAGLQQAGVDARLMLSDNERFRGRSAAGQTVRLLAGRQEYERCRREIERFKPDLIHLQNLFPSLSVGALRAVAEAGVPWVRSLRNYRLRCLAATLRYKDDDCRACQSAATGIRGVLRGCYRGGRATSAGALAVNLRDSQLSRRTARRGYIVLSHAMKEPLSRQLAGERVFIKPNIVPMSDIPDIVERPIRYDAAFVGRAVPEKGFETVLETARRAPELRFVAVGVNQDDWPGGGGGWPENVEAVGVVPHDEALAIMASSRTVLAPSVWEEPFGRVAVEALSVGAVPLVADRGGLPEIARLVDEALVLPHDDVILWVAAVRRFAGMTPEELISWRSGCQRVAEANFSSATLTAQLVSIYDQVAAGV